ncbi:hypothetical protein SAMN04487943_11217 [Gracilibacillus orientalis]|uniref:Uncharacterized protein n=1 Tax=Gracilibacillus orientalis TaxID=334253 RepID=A0A1I4PKX7_9BACI|nr:hypothetical protein [Gracilibacillus orientalis]SFM28472.1 hypothetical protein SAMN04487943_11217 [Gracilibacillus orientalis]
MSLDDAIRELERLIAIYYLGNNYVSDSVEFSREESRLIMRSIMQALEIAEMIKDKKL